MYVEDEIIKLYFQKVSPALILWGDIDCRQFPRHEFVELFFCYLKEYSETESTLLYQNLKNFSMKEKGANNLNVFSAVENVVSQILVLRDNEIKCNYSYLQRWREITRCLGEDFPICVFLVNQSRIMHKEWNFFYWNMIIGHTNTQLNEIMSRGISENHFHLYGSAPVFHLIWIKLMNNVGGSRYTKGLAEFDKKRRNHNKHFGRRAGEELLEDLILQAALIRAILFWYINLEHGECGVGLEYSEKVEEFIRCLTEGEGIKDIRYEIREFINLIKADSMFREDRQLPDYAITESTDDNLNWIFTGERKLMYRVLYKNMIEQTLPPHYERLFYAYLVIRTIVRGEIIQNNLNIGFENFSVYQKRKKDILTSKIDMKRMIIYAVHSSFRAGNLKSLEIRISPCNNYLDNARQIKTLDNYIISNAKVSKKQFYYVYHFCKKKDKYSLKGEDIRIPCRDAELRREIRKVGKGIIRLREKMPSEAARIKGIDACSQEIGCRPEVFAPTFRRLTSHITSFEEHDPVKQLKQTYHAGEDFLDIVDGLRAIDEAVHFLNMRNGDRFGHATVLGIEVSKWYENKHCMLFLPMQDYLDNIVWLYHKLLEFQIEGCEILKNYLSKEYQEYFEKIYGIYLKEKCSSSIYIYYDAWKLRGDNPEWYEKRARGKNTELYNPCIYAKNERFLGDYALNKEITELIQIRNKKEAVDLYLAYHYSKEVRKKGGQSIEVHIPQIYIEGVKKVQKEMQWMIGEKGIGIETNPTSNLLISSINGYYEHPILKLYNLGLKSSEDNDCAQLYISINTDDKGVFNTSLENEYALMASAMENMKDRNGKTYFTKQEIYDWIDRIRIMGNQQVFSTKDYERREERYYGLFDREDYFV